MSGWAAVRDAAKEGDGAHGSYPSRRDSDHRRRSSVAESFGDQEDLVGDIMRERAVTTALATGRLVSRDADRKGSRTVAVSWRNQPWFREESTETKDSFEEWLVGSSSSDLLNFQKAVGKLCQFCAPDSNFAKWAMRYRVLAFVGVATFAYGVRTPLDHQPQPSSQPPPSPHPYPHHETHTVAPRAHPLAACMLLARPLRC